jgi:hypothetical protein
VLVPAVLVCWLVGAAALRADPKDETPADQVTKGKDGYYQVQFQVGTTKVTAEFPGEPKLESDPKNTGERLYGFTTAKGRHYFIRVADNYNGKLLPDKDEGGLRADVLTQEWCKNDPRYKTARPRHYVFINQDAMEINLDEGKDKGFTQQYVFLKDGNFYHVGIDRMATDADAKRYYGSIKLEKADPPKTEVPVVEVPKDWVEHKLGKTPFKVYAPVQMINAFRLSKGDYGDYSLLLKDGKDTVFRVQLVYAEKAEDLQGGKGTILAMVPDRATRVTLAGVPGICSFKDGKAVGKEPDYHFYAYLDNYHVSVTCKGDKVAPADAEKVAVLLLQQLKK